MMRWGVREGNRWRPDCKSAFGGTGGLRLPNAELQPGLRRVTQWAIPRMREYISEAAFREGVLPLTQHSASVVQKGMQ